MALDTQAKRMNAVGVGRPWLRSKFPGVKDQAWRVASGNAYGGNEIAAPVVSVAANPSPRMARLLQSLLMQQRRRRRLLSPRHQPAWVRFVRLDTFRASGGLAVHDAGGLRRLDVERPGQTAGRPTFVIIE